MSREISPRVIDTLSVREQLSPAFEPLKFRKMAQAREWEGKPEQNNFSIGKRSIIYLVSAVSEQQIARALAKEIASAIGKTWRTALLGGRGGGGCGSEGKASHRSLNRGCSQG
jgi:hypothetical protein